MALNLPHREAEGLIISPFSYVSVASSKERERDTAVNHSRALGIIHCPVRWSIRRFRCYVHTCNRTNGFPDSSVSWWRICLQCRRPRFDSWVGKICWRRDKLPIPVFFGFPGASDGQESACNAGDLGLIPGLGRFPWRREWHPLQYSCLENPMDRGA